MYKGPNLLRKVHQNLMGFVGFVGLVETRLEEIEIAEDPAYDFWGTVMAQMGKQD